ncbi:MAG TPA: hypothetical protein DCX80_06835, partial [Chloroflexi bacterium]|nr:hypothetical protein [Chloroflexota bacterium]
MQAHAPKHHGGLIEYLERHLLVTFVTLAVLFAGVLAAIVITNTNDNAEPASVPEVAAPAPVTDFRYLEQNTELPPYTGAVEQPSITSSSHPGMGEGWVGGAARPAVVSPARNYPLAWARFLEVNGVVGALTAPVISVEQQRFLEENLYLPGDGASVEDVSGPRDITAYSHPGMGEG